MKTLKTINREAQKHGLQLAKGKDYFYWYSNDPKHPINRVKTQSINVLRLKHADWNRELQEILIECNKL